MPGRGTDATVPANKEAPMKKLVMTLTVLAFMSGSAAFAAAPAAEKDTKAAKDTKPAKEEKAAPAPKDDKAGADKAKK